MPVRRPQGLQPTSRDGSAYTTQEMVVMMTTTTALPPPQQPSENESQARQAPT
jgi:hypothetical protein